MLYSYGTVNKKNMQKHPEKPKPMGLVHL